uniref:heat stress transcription factor C-1 n=1 Tax=Erigeron canadensis TaxID=72917 RepID=UPI001CB99F22|nr:heat stress transcription factor C-1 [Erigeron canadensis]
MESNEVIAPFVMKTYQMVNDSSLDNLIRWGTSNNSFMVVDSLRFSQHLLPTFFKHNNFSSFIRQLNTYGFRKVDPDKWEFANEHFLRGQIHLLKNIGRRRQVTSSRGKYSSNMTRIIDDDEDDEEEEEMLMEIARLKQEQKVLEQEIVLMNKRLEVTERRPEQMMSLLCKVAEDPDILQRMMHEKVTRAKRLVDKKKRRMLVTPQLQATTSSSMETSSNYNFIKREEDELYDQTIWLWNKPDCDHTMESKAVNTSNKRYVDSTEGGSSGSSGGDTIYFGNGLPEPDVRPAPTYPFSLLGGGF